MSWSQDPGEDVDADRIGTELVDQLVGGNAPWRLRHPLAGELTHPDGKPLERLAKPTMSMSFIA